MLVKRSIVVCRGLGLERSDSAATDTIMYRKSNSKSIAASSFLRLLPYFYFRFGRKWPPATAFDGFCTSNARLSFVDQWRAFSKIGRRQILVLPICPKPEVVF